ncbi:hypothetical protein Y032_0013g2049 [Ancylostoma ceylanicum]|nr:hypothetical protein Y032_0013g2049 [Ancylostoma ceylanicum]
MGVTGGLNVPIRVAWLRPHDDTHPSSEHTDHDYQRHFAQGSVCNGTISMYCSLVAMIGNHLRRNSEPRRLFN